MRYMIGALLMVMLATAALADDTRQYTNCHGLWLPVDECENSQLEAGWYSPKTVQPYDDHSVTPSSYYDVGSDDIIPLLEQCLEYIPDSSVIYNDPTTSTYLTDNMTLAIYRLRSAQLDAEDAAEQAQKSANDAWDRAERMKRQTELNHKIKEIIKRMGQ